MGKEVPPWTGKELADYEAAINALRKTIVKLCDDYSILEARVFELEERARIVRGEF